jgi:hypothetical protein
MRKIIVFNLSSLDGYHTGPDNEVSVMFPMMGGVFDTYTAERLRTADTTLLGRVSFQLFNSFWPEVAKDPTAPQWTDEQRELSQAGASVPTIVVSDTLPDNWPQVRIIRRADAHQQIEIAALSMVVVCGRTPVCATAPRRKVLAASVSRVLTVSQPSIPAVLVRPTPPRFPPLGGMPWMATTTVRGRKQVGLRHCC